MPLPRYSTDLTVLRLPTEDVDLRPIKTKQEKLDAYAGWVYAATSRIAWDIRDNPWDIWKRTGRDRNDWQAVDPSRVSPILLRPNETMTWGQFIETTALHLDLSGEWFWKWITDEAGRDVGLEILYPHWIVQPNLSDDGMQIETWDVAVPGRVKETVPARDIIFGKYPHPLDPLIGCSPVERFALSYDIDMYARAYGATLLRGNAVPTVALTSDNPNLTTEESDILAERWMDRHMGRPNRPAVFRKGTDVKVLGLALGDLEFASLSQLSMEQIFACYGTNAAVLGVKTEGGLGRADSEMFERQHQKNALRPRLRRFDEAINLFIMPRLYGREAKTLYYEHEDPVTEDRQFLLDKAKSLVDSGMILVNDGLQMIGEESKPDGDVYLVPVGRERVPAGLLNKPTPQIADQKRGSSHIMESDTAELAELRFLRAQDPFERSTKARIRALFSKEQKAVAQAFKEHGKRNVVSEALQGWMRRDWIDDTLGALSPEWRELVGDTILTGVRSGWSLFADEFTEAVDWALYEKRASDIARRLAGEHVKSIESTTVQGIRRVISDGIEEGKSVTKIADDLRDLYDGFKGARSETIARTETANSINQGKQAAAEETSRKLGLDLKKRWVATKDERTRDSHRDANGDLADLDKPFRLSSGHSLMYPGDPAGPASETIRCRCVVAYEEQKK